MAAWIEDDEIEGLVKISENKNNPPYGGIMISFAKNSVYPVRVLLEFFSKALHLFS